LETLNFKLTWKKGKERAQDILKNCNYSLEELDISSSVYSGVSMKCLFGVVLPPETTDDSSHNYFTHR